MELVWILLTPPPLLPDRERHPPRHQELHSDHPHGPRDPVQRPSVSRNPCSSSTLLSCTRPCAAPVSCPLPHLDLTVSPTKVRSGGGFHYATRQPHDRGPNVMPWLGVHDQEGGGWRKRTGKEEGFCVQACEHV